MSVSKILTFLIVFSLSSLTLLGAQTTPLAGSVTIYGDYSSALLGRSSLRQIKKTYKLSSLQSAKTLPVAKESGFRTGVLISPVRAGQIMRSSALSHQNMAGHTIYTYNKNDIKFSFSLEKPSKTLLDSILAFYKDKKAKAQVRESYQEGYIITIFSAPNVIANWNEEITYPEALLVATLIGDVFQPLWGMHDGKDWLKGKLPAGSAPTTPAPAPKLPASSPAPEAKTQPTAPLNDKETEDSAKAALTSKDFKPTVRQDYLSQTTASDSSQQPQSSSDTLPSSK